MSNSKPKYYLNALGVINALGNNKKQVADHLFAGHQPGIVKRDDLVLGNSVYVGQVNADLPMIPKALSNYDCRNNQLLLAAYEQIREPVETAIKRYGKNRVAIVLGSSTSGISEGERALKTLAQQGELPDEFHYKQQEIGTCAEFFAEYLGLENLAYTITTACSSSAKAFSSARRLLEQGLCDAVIVGGVDTLCQLTLNGFSALQSVSDKICNPFSANRNGITIGEGAALFLMTGESSEIVLFGVGCSADAYHISSPEPQGKGAESAIRAALNDAGLEPNEIDYVNLHGTATPKNDEMESRAVSRIFGAEVFCSSTKAQIGHTLGAAGATEVAFCWLTLSGYNEQAVLPPQLWDGEIDPLLAELNFAAVGSPLTSNKQHYFLSNSFAFGGSNAAVIIGNAQ
jgi:3-oxoacyl-[acyl-carrier-protein] synthase-1